MTEQPSPAAPPPQSHGHQHGAGSNTRQLVIALSLTATFLAVEVAGGLIFNSLALLSDAAHMLTDAAALAIALAAIKIGQKQADDRRTFGYRRFEILAAAFNALLLFAVAGYVLYEGIKRLIDPEPVESIGMLLIAAAGLAVNLIAMRVLAGSKDKSLNVKGAYLEVWSDMLGSLGVLLAAGIIWLTKWAWVDPVVAIAIGLWVLPRTWILLRDTTHILLEGAPQGVVIGDLRTAILAVPGVAALHDLHAWVSGADQPSATVHVTLEEGADPEAVRGDLTRLLAARFGIEHSTVQVETRPVDGAEELH